MAASDHPVTDHIEGPDLRSDGRNRCRPYHLPAGGVGRRAQLGLPLLLASRRYVHFVFTDAVRFTEEASAWIEWLLRAIAGDPGQLQIMYGLAGERRLTEFELPHLAGYEKSIPVRIGNAASEQFQLDVYGEILDAMHLARTVGIDSGASSWRLQRLLVKFVEKNWDKPDNGLWEIRGPRRHFTHSKLMAWVAIDRAVKAVEQFGLEGDLSHWKNLRHSIHQDVCLHGYNPRRKAFTQFYGSDNLDASLLMMPLVGFLPPSDDRVIATVELIQKELVVDGFVLRYHPDSSAHVDGLPPGEGSFLPCSFWLVDCLCLLERREEARALFERLMLSATVLDCSRKNTTPKNGGNWAIFPSLYPRWTDQFRPDFLTASRSIRSPKQMLKQLSVSSWNEPRW